MGKKTRWILVMCAQLLGFGWAAAHPPSVIGSWTVAITFANGPERFLRFDAHESGKGSFLVLDPTLKVWQPAQPSEAKWTQADNGSVVFSGSVEFPLGNVGRDAGTLVLKGKFGADGAIEGAAAFFSLEQDPNDAGAKAAKSGSFKATRASDHN